jgi:N-acetylmuramoyl-L-alanine amidase
MPAHPPRARETLDLIRRFQTAAARRRKQRLILACVGGAAFLGVIAVIVALALPGSGQQVAAGAPTSPVVQSSSTAAVTTTSEGTAALVTATTLTSGGANSPEDLAVQTTTASTAAPPGHTGGYVVVIDPGHQAKADYGQEPVGPGSAVMKAKVSSGTHSVNTGTPESQLVLTIGLKLRDSLQAHGIQVVMTRTTQDVAISNVQRAQMANDAGADLFVRIHADGAGDSSLSGILMLYPATTQGWTDDIAAESKRAARLALDKLVTSTGARSRGLSARSDLTGFNWSDIPVILPEIGLMTNQAEDALLATDDYQSRIVQGLTDAILNYLGVS